MSTGSVEKCFASNYQIFTSLDVNSDVVEFVLKSLEQNTCSPPCNHISVCAIHHTATRCRGIQTKTLPIAERSRMTTGELRPQCPYGP